MVDEFKELGTSMRDVPFAWYKRQSVMLFAMPRVLILGLKLAF